MPEQLKELEGKSRDWSVWIDTIETSAASNLELHVSSMSGLICLDWYDWNGSAHLNPTTTLPQVGIDLFGLIRLKHRKPRLGFHDFAGRDWSVWIDTIETKHSRFPVRWWFHVGVDLFGLIRLKHITDSTKITGDNGSGLICLDWYDWNSILGSSIVFCNRCRDCSVWIDTIETSPVGLPRSRNRVVGIALFGLIRLKPSCGVKLTKEETVVGIDLSGLIRLKLDISCLAPSGWAVSGLICLDWYDWNRFIVAPMTP